MKRFRRLLGFILLAGSAATAVNCGTEGASERGGEGIPVQAAVPPADEYVLAVERLEEFIRHEMEDKDLPALSIALVDDQRFVWAAGFGYADREDSIPATAETVYRVGSVSKLFTDLAVMQLVEAGDLDLDTPIREHLPEFRPRNPYDSPITLRQLMAHRAGLVREPPIGNYFDPSEPSLAATVASLNETRLVYEPGTRTKYSNAGSATAGYVLEKASARPFAEYVREAILEPLGMDRSAFGPRADLLDDLADGVMWTYDGRQFGAPTFEFGMAPAGSMYSTVTDLGRFLQALFNAGEGQRGRILEHRTLESMWTPQFEDGSRFGIGFSLSELDGRRRVGHGGAAYGFATQLFALPDEQMGVVVVTNVDIANAVVARIADAALRLMVAARHGQRLPALETTDPVPPTHARRIEGAYGSGAEAVRLEARGGSLFLIAPPGERILEVGRVGDTLVADSRLGYGPRVLPLDGAIVVDGDTLERVRVSRPAPVSERMRGLIGEYGWDHNVLSILEQDGRLYALIEWFFLYPLWEAGPDRFEFPDRGLYHGEQIVFERRADGRAIRLTAGGVVFERRRVGASDASTPRIDPVRPVEELRAAALEADMPPREPAVRQPELVEPAALDSTIRLDIRYATRDNFLGITLYPEPRAYLQRPAAEALVRAHRQLLEHGYGLLVFDAYRPWYVTRMFWDATPTAQKHFVADPSNGSRHNRGAAVDLTLYEVASGRVVEMPSGYDEFSPRAYPAYPGGTARARWHRDLLRRAMESEGFTVYEWEWWHFDHESWRDYPVLNRTFEQLATDGASASPDAP